MSQVREIKCPHCGEWTMWNGNVDDRCLFCNEFIEPQRFSREIEKKVVTEVKKENDYFALNPSDNYLKHRIKLFLNSVRWMAVYLQIGFFIFITAVIVLISLLVV